MPARPASCSPVRFNRILACGHWIGLDHLGRRLEMLALMPCSECVHECEDHHRWLDDRADEDASRDRGR